LSAAAQEALGLTARLPRAIVAPVTHWRRVKEVGEVGKLGRFSTITSGDEQVKNCPAEPQSANESVKAKYSEYCTPVKHISCGENCRAS